MERRNHVNCFAVECKHFQGKYGKYYVKSKMSYGGYGTIFKAKVENYDNRELLKRRDKIIVKI